MTDILADLYSHVEALFPLCRSITGDGLRATLAHIAEHIPLTVREVPTGTAVLDWEIPQEWNVRDAAIYSLAGDRVVDFKANNLHLLQYSEPIDRIVPRDQLEAHLYSLPDRPDLIPYRTSYYNRTWGFCLSHRQRLSLSDCAYRVVIDSSLEAGSLSYGECYLPGTLTQEVLFSVHCCHPSLANDNLSAIAVAIELARKLVQRPRRFSYRFLFAPGTIGAITWLHFNQDASQRIRHGLVLACLGDDGSPSYKRSRRGDAAIDRYTVRALREAGNTNRVKPFSPIGYDERQYCSPGFDLPMGCLMRSPPKTFPEYHTSADSLGFVRPSALGNSLGLLESIVNVIEQDTTWRSTQPYGEPQLSRRGLYSSIGGVDTPCQECDRETLLWVLNLADGRHSLFDIAERSDKPFKFVVAAAAALAKAGLLRQDY